MTQKLPPKEKRMRSAIDKMIEITADAAKGNAGDAVDMVASLLIILLSQLKQDGLMENPDKDIDSICEQVKSSVLTTGKGIAFGDLH